MAGQCSICLSDYVEPVCIPCGHIYCLGCITVVVNGPNDLSTAVKCPTCRTDFHLVVPDLTFLPKKYHPFVVRPLRRIFIDESPDALTRRALEKDVTKLKAHIASLQQSEERLMQQCERHQGKSRAYRDREREARKEKDNLEARCLELAAKVSGYEEEAENVDTELCYMRIKNLELQREAEKTKAENDALRKRLEGQRVSVPNKSATAPIRRRGPTRTIVDEFPSSNDEGQREGEDFDDSSPVRGRVVRPLPRRTRKSVVVSSSSPVKAPEAKKPRLSEGNGRRVVRNASPIETRSRRLLRSSASAIDFNLDGY